MRWAKAASRRQPFATTSPRSSRAGGSRCSSWSTRQTEPSSRHAELVSASIPQTMGTFTEKDPETSSGRRLSEELGIDHDPPAVQIGDAGFERDQQAPAVRAFNLEQVSGAVIFDTGNRANDLPLAVDRAQADEIGVIIFPFIERRQRRAVDLDERSAQRFGGRAVENAFEARNRGLAAVPDAEEAPFRASDIELLVPGQALRAVTEQLEPQLAFDAMRAGNRGERDSTLAALAHAQPWLAAGSPSASPSAGSSLDWPLSAPASAGCGDSVLGGGTSSAPSAGSAADSPSFVASGWSAAASSAGASLVSGVSAPSAAGGACSATSSATASVSAVGSAVAASTSSPTTASASSCGAAAASAASAAFLVRSSARSLAFSPGSAFFGLFRAARSRMPAASRKRSTRSDGCAPTASQCWIRSVSSLTRSGESFASSGL